MVNLRSGTMTESKLFSNGSSGTTANGLQTSLHNNGHSKVSNCNSGIQETKVVDDSQYTNNNRSMQLVTFVSLILDLLGFTVILPLFPALLEYYSHHDSSGFYAWLHGGLQSIQETLGVPERFNAVLFGGLLGSLFSLLQFVSSPIIGALSDNFGRKPILLMTLTGVAVSYGLWAVAGNFLIFVVARIIGGLCKGNVSLSYSIMTDICDKKSRAKGMALIGVAFSLGFIVGPAVGAGFSRWGSSGWFASSAIYALVLSIINIVYVAVFFKETFPQAQLEKSVSISQFSSAWSFINPVSLFSFQPIQGLAKKDHHQLVKLGRIYFLFLFIYSGLEFTLTFVTHLKHNYSSMDQGRMFAFIGLTMAIMQGGFVRRMKAGMEKMTAIAGFIIIIPSFAFIGISDTSILLYFGLALYSIGSSMMVPCLTALVSTYGDDGQKGSLLGIWRSLGALARALGPIATSVGFWCFGAAWCYALGGLAMVIPLVLLIMS